MRDKAAGAVSERGQPAPGPVILKPGMETVPRRKARERGSGSSPHTAQTSPERGSAWGPSRAPGRPRESDGSLKGSGGSDQADERRQQRYNNDLSCPGSPRPTHLLCSNVSGKSLCPLLSAEHLCPGGVLASPGRSCSGGRGDVEVEGANGAVWRRGGSGGLLGWCSLRLLPARGPGWCLPGHTGTVPTLGDPDRALPRARRDLGTFLIEGFGLGVTSKISQFHPCHAPDLAWSAPCCS